ncbi:unnamed protein product [Ilex paraguariensis]|uniref:DUS-like FMN-binding domain-containing protein n=1 Tax=Ilex paraguariensis TaxID=185542 RepID=A0ABC8U8K6_9AQUA
MSRYLLPAFNKLVFFLLIVWSLGTSDFILFYWFDQDRFLGYTPEQHPIVLQIGGSNLDNLAKAIQLSNAYGYDEINFNCGCPSPKVAGRGCFGARLMLDPKFVAEAMSVIAANTDVPVSVKCRIGVDNRDSYNELCEFFIDFFTVFKAAMQISFY